MAESRLTVRLIVEISKIWELARVRKIAEQKWALKEIIIFLFKILAFIEY